MAQTTVSVGFEYGLIGEADTNAHQPERGVLFSTLGIVQAVISQVTDDGRFGGSQGNDYDVDVTFLFSDGSSTTFPAAVNWRDSDGGTVVGIGLIGGTAAPADGTAYTPRTADGFYTSYLFRFVGQSRTYTETAMNIKVPEVSGNAAGALDALNDYLTSSPPSATPSVLTSTIVASEVTILADGETTTTITVQLKDVNGNNLTSSGGVLVLETTLGELGEVIDNEDGTYTVILTSAASAGTATITGTLGGTAIKDTASVQMALESAPVITGPSGAAGAETSEITVDENQTAVTQVTADVPVTWSITGGSDRLKFDIAPDGTITFLAAPNYETPTDADTNNTYVLTITADDGNGNTSVQTITVTVRNELLPGETDPDLTDADGDGTADDIESDTADRDGDGIVDSADYDPQGYFYCQSDGRILDGGSVSVSGPGAVTMVADGALTGEYQWFVDAAGTYTMSIITTGMEFHTIAVASAGSLTLASRADNPIIVGSTEDGLTGILGDFNGVAYNPAAPTPYYTQFVIAEGDANLYGNNIPFLDCAVQNVAVTAVQNGAEPNGTTQNGQFTISLTRVSSVDTIVYYTMDGTATSGLDYTALSGFVTIPAGQLSATVVIVVASDEISDSGETVRMTLSSVTGDSATVLTGTPQDSLTISEGLIDQISQDLQDVLQDDLEKTIQRQSAQFSALSKDALGRLQNDGLDKNCGSASPLDVDGSANAGTAGVNINATISQENYDCATEQRFLKFGSVAVTDDPSQGTQSALTFGIAREVQDDRSVRGRFLGWYYSSNPVDAAAANGQIDGLGLNLGVYGAADLGRGLYLDHYAAAALGYHRYALQFAPSISATGDYSYGAGFAGAALSGELKYDKIALRPRAGFDLGYAMATEASVSVQDGGLSETGFVALDPVLGLRVFAETGVAFESGSESDPSKRFYDVYEISPRVFCENGTVQTDLDCGYGVSVSIASKNKQKDSDLRVTLDQELIGDLTRSYIEIARQRRILNGAGDMSMGVAVDADGNPTAKHGYELKW